MSSREGSWARGYDGQRAYDMLRSVRAADPAVRSAERRVLLCVGCGQVFDFDRPRLLCVECWALLPFTVQRIIVHAWVDAVTGEGSWARFDDLAASAFRVLAQLRSRPLPQADGHPGDPEVH